MAVTHFHKIRRVMLVKELEIDENHSSRCTRSFMS